MCGKEKDLIENIYQIQLDFASCFGGINGISVIHFIENIDVNKLEEKLAGKLKGSEITDIILKIK